MERSKLSAFGSKAQRFGYRGDRRFDIADTAQAVGQVEMEDRDLGRHLDGLPDRLFRRSEVSRAHQHMAELSEAMRIGRLDLDRLPAQRDCLSMASLRAQHMTELTVGVGQLRIDFDGRAQCCFSGGQVAPSQLQIAQARMSLDAFGSKLDG